MSLILGINAFHGDSAACILRGGKLIAAAEEERFRRVKHWAGFPSQSVRYCLREVGARLDDVDHIGVNHDGRANMLSKLAFAVKQRPDLSTVIDRIRSRKDRSDIAGHLRSAFPSDRFDGRVHAVEHHLAHLSSAFHVSPFEEAVAVSVDGFGDFASAAWGVGRGTSLSVDDRVLFPHSLGIFYMALTQYLGFRNYGDEYKVMGLAPYGEPAYVNDLRRVVRIADDGTFELGLDYFRHHRETIEKQWEGGYPVVDVLYSPELEELLGPARLADQPLEQRHKDIARSTQVIYEEAFLRLLNALHARYGISDLALAGGCAMNSVANGKVLRSTPFKRLYVQSAAGDAGGAIGAAFATWHKLDERAPRFSMEHAYWGPEYDESHIRQLLDTKRTELGANHCSVKAMGDEGELCAETARAIAQGLVVGWFQGRMEWGPRALGNRSIVCDPRRTDMKELLNLKIKRRESFRPFAPSILREHVSEWFEQDDEVPFMMQVYPIRESKRALVPAVTHVDGSGRLQTVYRHTNPRYYRLIEHFQRLTGVPMVLNTSFNENEPVVCRPDEALDCFLRTRMDVLVMGDAVLTRNSDDPA